VPRFKAAKSAATDGRAVQGGQDDRVCGSADSDDAELMRRWLRRFVGSRPWEGLAGCRVVIDFPAATARSKSRAAHPPFPPVNFYSPWFPRRRVSKAKFARLLKRPWFFDVVPPDGDSARVEQRNTIHVGPASV